MDYSNEYNLNQFKNNQYISDQTLFKSDSEFDEFDHHISQYDNKHDLMDYESNSDDQNRPLEDEEEEEFYSDENNQLSLATSFCKNTQQEHNEDFLEDKFNGEFLIDQFSEDKFIRCKYSEDFYLEQYQQFNKHQLNSETDDDIQNEFNEQDRQLNEERSSEDERIIEKRKQHFLEFISTLPKICTPSVCGTMSSTQNQFTDNRELNLGKLTEANEDELFDNEDDDYDEFDNSHKNVSEKVKNQDNLNSFDQHKFDWSIDQLATLKPVDISINERKFLRFKEFESDQLTQEKLIKENELFFSQETIAPSPTKQTSSFKHLDFSLLGNEIRKNKENKFNSKEEDDGKDSGNYSGSEIDKISNLDLINKNDKLNEFELSFIEHSTKNRLSKIEFDCEMMNTKMQLNTPLSIKETELIKNNINNDNKLNQFNRLQQTSTPCSSIIRHQQQKQQFKNLINHNNDNLMNNQSRNSSLPLQERNNIKQKKRLFHNLTTNNDNLLNNNNSSSFINESINNNSIRSSKSSNFNFNYSNNNDEGVYESSRELLNTFNSSTNTTENKSNFTSPSNRRSSLFNHQHHKFTTNKISSQLNLNENESTSLMSIYDNNSLTPRFKKQRDSSFVKSIGKSFADRLNEIELFNDENTYLNNHKNDDDNYNLKTSDSLRSPKKWHNLTDSNCFVAKNFNNLLNNSDSGCYLSNSNSNSNSGFSLKKNNLF